jgi:hypothetical protein
MNPHMPQDEFEQIERRLAGYRCRYPLWLCFAVIAGIVAGTILVPHAIVPVWAVYAMTTGILVALVSIPYFLYFSSHSPAVSMLLKILILVSTILSLIASYFAAYG